MLGDVTLGAHSSVWYGAVLRGDINRIVVGHHSNIQDNAVLHLADDFACVVGNWVTVGHSAIVHACNVGDEVLVGMGAVILDGAVIGKQSHHRREGAGDAGNENPARLARARRAGESRPQTDKGRTRRTEMVGAKIRGQRRVLPEAQNQRRRADEWINKLQPNLRLILLHVYEAATELENEPFFGPDDQLKLVARSDYGEIIIAVMGDQVSFPWCLGFRRHQRVDWKLQPRLYRDAYALKATVIS